MNFSNISAYEFEKICRDIIFEQTKIILVVTNVGKDGGIDFKSQSTNELQIIGQAKHYQKSSFDKLKSSAVEDALKVKNKTFDTYYFMTSFDLSNQQKEKIEKEIYEQLPNQDIIVFGLSDVNDALNTYTNIKIRYINLYTSSLEFLQSVIQLNRVNEVIANEFINPKKLIKSIRQFPFYEAKKKLLNNHFIVLVGEPGVGKTEVSRQLVADLMSQKSSIDFKYFSSDQIHKIGTQLTNNTIYLLDDFLGRNSLEHFNKGSENQSIINLIEFVANIKDTYPETYFILNSRINIINDAKQESSGFSQLHLENYKIEIRKMTNIEKAEILKIHLQFSELETEQKELFLSDAEMLYPRSKMYMHIIEHKNFNPRLIENLINGVKHKNIKTQNELYNVLKRPYELYKEILPTKKLEKSLLILYLLHYKQKNIKFLEFINLAEKTLKINKEDVEKFIEKFNESFFSITFNNNVKYIDLVNPGIYEVLKVYIGGKNIDTKNILKEYEKYYSDNTFMLTTTITDIFSENEKQEMITYKNASNSVKYDVLEDKALKMKMLLEGIYDETKKPKEYIYSDMLNYCTENVDINQLLKIFETYNAGLTYDFAETVIEYEKNCSEDELIDMHSMIIDSYVRYEDNRIYDCASEFIRDNVEPDVYEEEVYGSVDETQLVEYIFNEIKDEIQYKFEESDYLDDYLSYLYEGIENIDFDEQIQEEFINRFDDPPTEYKEQLKNKLDENEIIHSMFEEITV